jgi:hypothetical protein
MRRERIDFLEAQITRTFKKGWNILVFCTFVINARGVRTTSMSEFAMISLAKAH